MLRLVVSLAVMVGLASAPLVQAADIQTVRGGSADAFQEAAIPAPDHDKMEELDRLLEKYLEGQQVPAVPNELVAPDRDNQEDKPDGGSGK